MDYEIIDKKEEEYDIIENKENKKKYKQIEIPTTISHPYRRDPRIPLIIENSTWLAVPENIITAEYLKIVKTYSMYSPSKLVKPNYIYVPEEWIYYIGNPAFIDINLLDIHS